MLAKLHVVLSNRLPASYYVLAIVFDQSRELLASIVRLLELAIHMKAARRIEKRGLSNSILTLISRPEYKSMQPQQSHSEVA